MPQKQSKKKSPLKRQRGGTYEFSDQWDIDNELSLGAITNDLDRVQEALKHGANANAPDQRTAQSPIMLAAHHGNLQMASLLLENGADVNDADVDANRNTALMYASSSGDQKVVTLLIESGANINAKNKNNQTALMRASEDGHPQVVTTLLEKGADVNAKDKWNKTAIFHAIDQGNTDVVPILLKYDIDLNIKNKNNLTALEYAKRKEYDDIVKLIEDHIKEKKQKTLLEARLVTEKGKTREGKPLLASTQADIASQIAEFAGGKRKTRKNMKNKKTHSKRRKTSKKK